MTEIMGLNFIFTLTHKSFEADNKRITEWFDYKRFNT